MATYDQIKKGSSGTSVKELQKILNQNGYSLKEDGIFGSKTLNAVKDYQKNNNLKVDGIVGNNTWSSLYGKNTAASAGAADVNKTPAKTTPEYLADYEANKPTYTQSEAVNAAAEQLQNYEALKPGAYTGSYDTQIKNLMNDILNREEFSYDFNADPLYQQYKDQYVNQGKLAMADAMGNAAALSGGYGNSYAQTVGQQTYQGYLQGLNNVIPELRDAAYRMYADEGDRMLNNLSMLQSQDALDYGRYRDNVSDYYNDLNYYYGKYNDEKDSDYNRYLANLDSWNADRDYYFNKLLSEQDQANWEAEFALAAGKAGGGGGSDDVYYNLDTVKKILGGKISQIQGLKQDVTQSQLTKYLDEKYENDEINTDEYKQAYAWLRENVSR